MGCICQAHYIALGFHLTILKFYHRYHDHDLVNESGISRLFLPEVAHDN